MKTTFNNNITSFEKVQQEVLQKRQKEKKEMLEAVKNFKKREYASNTASALNRSSDTK